MAQTFTPGITGELTKLDFYSRRHSPTTAEMNIHIYPTVGENPSTDGDPLATAALTLGTDTGWYTVEFSSPAHLEAGKQYAMVFFTPTGYGNYLYLQFADVYLGGDYCLSMNGGSSWYIYNYDLAFRTYMAPSASASAPAMISPNFEPLLDDSMVDVIGPDVIQGTGMIAEDSPRSLEGNTGVEVGTGHLAVLVFVMIALVVATGVVARTNRSKNHK
jgi:hypothetical protein